MTIHLLTQWPISTRPLVACFERPLTLHDALSSLQSGPIADGYRIKRLTLSEFQVLWELWGRIQGLQEKWAARFLAGYETDSGSIRRRFDSALAKKSNDREAA